MFVIDVGTIAYGCDQVCAIQLNRNDLSPNIAPSWYAFQILFGVTAVATRPLAVFPLLSSFD